MERTKISPLRKLLLPAALILALLTPHTASAAIADAQDPFGPIHCTLQAVPDRDHTRFARTITPLTHDKPLDPNFAKPLSGCGGFIGGFRLSSHAIIQMATRNISPAQVSRTLSNGRRYADPQHGSTVYHYNNINVAINNGVITTAYKGSVSGRIIPLKH